MQKIFGFTLIELMMVIVIIGIIAGIGIPRYLDYTLRAHRADAHIALLELQVNLEEYYAEHQTYPTTLTSSQQTSKNNYYFIAISNPDGNQSYLLTATAKESQAHDTPCSKIKISHTGLRSGETSEGAANDQCW